LHKKKILIIGGTGFIGYHLAKKCLLLGWDVTSLSTKKPTKKKKLKIKYLYCDISKKLKLYQVLKNLEFDYIVNLGGYVDHSKNLKTFNSHYIGVKNLANFFSRKSIKRFVQMGSSLEYGHLPSPHKEKSKTEVKKLQSIYSRSKLMATNFLIKKFKLDKFPVVIFRLYLTYGPLQDSNRLISIVINNCINDKKFPTSSGKQKRDFIFIDDLIEILIKSLNTRGIDGEIFNLASGKPIRVKSIILKIRKLIKKGIPQFGKIPMRKDEQTETYANIIKLKKIFKKKKFINISSGLKKTINSLKKNAI
jgi:nucleoside-diphosphate-sugar epimerase